MSSLHVRIDDKIKKEVQKILEDLGLDMSTAVNMYFSQIALHQGIPFEVTKERRVPDHVMEDGEQETQEALASGKSYNSAAELHADILGENCEY